MHAPTSARQRPQRLLSVGLRADGKEKEEEAGDFGRRAEGQERLKPARRGAAIKDLQSRRSVVLRTPAQ